MFNSYYASRFPEDLYLVYPGFEDDYKDRTIYGFNRMAESSITVGILARDIEQILPYTLARLSQLRAMVSSMTLIAYENDSKDTTKTILFPAVDFLISETLEWTRNQQDKTIERRQRMAYYRNRLKSEMTKHQSDYYMIYDADIEGGFSYEGLANSFSYEWDVCGSNSVMYDIHDDKKRRLYYDSWAFRPADDLEDGNAEQKNMMCFHRGEMPIGVASCFGGLALYRGEVYRDPKYKYDDWDCDHPTIHIPMFQDGLSIVMNPSQITLYSKTRFVD